MNFRLATEVPGSVASKLLLAQVPPMGGPDRVRLRLYPGGHMFYARGESLAAFREDARALYQGRPL